MQDSDRYFAGMKALAWATLAQAAVDFQEPEDMQRVAAWIHGVTTFPLWCRVAGFPVQRTREEIICGTFDTSILDRP